MKNKYTPFLFIFIFLTVNLYSQEIKIKKLNNEIIQLTEVQTGLKNLHSELLDVKVQVDSLNMKAKLHQNNNQLKIVLKTFKDLYSLITDGPSSMFDVVKSTIENLYIEPYYQKSRKVKVDFEKIKIERNLYTTELKKIYSTLSLMLKSDLRYFDDDMPTSDITRKYWKEGDGQPDDEIELATRKLYVITGLSKELSDKIEVFCKRIRTDYLMFDNVKDENKRLIKHLQKEMMVNNKIRESHKKRMTLVSSFEKNADEKPKKIEKSKNKIDYKNSSERAKNHNPNSYNERENPMDSFAAEKKSHVEFIKKGYELGKNALVSFEIDPRSKLISGWSIGFQANIKPQKALGELVWKIDDLIVGYNELRTTLPAERKFSFVFETPGIYDVSVELEVNGKFVDKYLTHISIEPNTMQKEKEKSIIITVFNNSEKKSIIRKKETTKIQIVNLPYAKYWVSGIEGQKIISGFYFNMMGKKLSYESLKIIDYNSSNPTYGFFALKSLNGYHVYRTMENDEQVLIISLLGQKGPEIINKIKKVKNFEIEINPDYSSAKIIYDTKLNLNKKIELK